MADPRYPSIWACLGMVLGLYGVAYAYAAWRLDRARPIIAIGLAGKILGPIGWFLAVGRAELPFRTFPLPVFNDLIWWLPFGLFLLEGTRVAAFLKRTAPQWCTAVHVVAGIGTWFFLREVRSLDHWRFGWLLWMFAALTLLGFYAWWGSRTAFVIASLGLFCDFAGESLFIGWLATPGTPLYRVAALLTGGAANALYTIAGILLTLKTPALPPFVKGWAWLAWASGIALTLFTFADWQTGVIAASAGLIVFFTPLPLLVARWRA